MVIKSPGRTGGFSLGTPATSYKNSAQTQGCHREWLVKMYNFFRSVFI